MEAARFAIVLPKKLPTCGALIALGFCRCCTPPAHGPGQHAVDAALSLYLGSNGSNDNHGIYSACMDPSNGFAYFGATYAYKVDIRGAVPRQVGNGVSLGHQANSAVMDPTAGCAYFASGMSIVQILANGTNAPSLGASMNAPFGTSPTPFTAQLLLDDSDPANHYLYVMTDTGSTNSTLYKIALNLYPSPSSIVGSASINPGEPAMYYGASTSPTGSPTTALISASLRRCSLYHQVCPRFRRQPAHPRRRRGPGHDRTLRRRHGAGHRPWLRILQQRWQ